MRRQFYIGFLCLTCIVLLCQGKEHKKKVPYEVKHPEVKCSTASYTVCVLWICGKRYKEVCNTHYVTTIQYRYECEDGWIGSSCDVPICTNCPPGKTCVEPNRCECLETGGVCQSVPCSTDKSCFPGTCKDGNCACPSSFEGEDCNKLKVQPTFSSCDVTISDTTSILATSECGYENTNPKEVIINRVNFNTILMNMRVDSPHIIDMPSSPEVAHVRFPVPMGITDAKFKVLQDEILLLEMKCEHVQPDHPKPTLNCNLREQIALVKMEHRNRIDIVASAKLGGYKEGSKISDNINSYFSKVRFEGDEVTRKVVFRIDSLPPFHCYNKDCDYFPIQLMHDITDNPQVEPTFYGWNDSDSGIKEMQFKVYFMSLSESEHFENVGRPIIERILKPGEADFNNVVFSCKKPGVHSIELIVFDGANNTAKARNIFIYTGPSKLKSDEEKPVQVESANFNSKTKEFWITKYNFHVGMKAVKISWANHFVSNARFSEEWSNPVQPWGAEGLDDKAMGDTLIGMRTIDRMRSLPDGIMNYSINYFIDEINGGVLENYTEAKVFPSTSNTFVIDLDSSSDGTAIGVILRAHDVAGSSLEEKFKIRIDTTAPELLNWTLKANDPDKYTSRVSIALRDLQSGVDKINFKLIDKTFKNIIKEGEAEISTRDPPSLTLNSKKHLNMKRFVGACEKDAPDCYCTPHRACFSLIQSIDIDHCWIDRQVKAKNKIVTEFEVFNQAGLTTGKKTLELINLDELHCRPTKKLTGAQIFGIIICVVIGIVLLSAVLLLLIRIYVLKKSPPAIITNISRRSRRHVDEPISCTNELYMAASEDVRNQKPKSKARNSHHESKGVKLVDETSSPFNLIAEDDVAIEEEICKGSVMIITKGFFNDGTHKLPVAVKSLKKGAAIKSIAAMEAKAGLLATLPTHDNIVKVFGLIKSNQGCMIVMEYCDTTLKSWLSNVTDVSMEVLDDILDIATGIARGMEHLHINEIIHRRLAVRNVLISKHFSQFVPKLIGFGSEEENGGDNVSVPIKWLSPETLATINKKCTLYGKATDSWSYGITLWEVYTLGKRQPYPEFGNKEAGSKIISGAKMERPTDCPLEMYNKVVVPCWSTNPKERPSFSEISRLMDDFKRGNQGAPGDYYVVLDGGSKSISSDQAYYTDGS